MTELVLPPALVHARNSFRYIDSTGVTHGVYSGIVQTTAYGGDRVGCTIEFAPHGGASTLGKSARAQLQSFLMSLRGKQNRVYVTDNSYRQRGSFPTAEMFTNPDFSNGTTGWTVDFGTLVASDGTMRLTASQGGGSNTEFRQSVTIGSYTPYVLRSFILDGLGTSGLSIGPSMTLNASISSSDYATSRGYRLCSGVSGPTASLAQFPAVFASTSGFTAGSYISCPFTSLSQCFLVDGGGNSLLQSDTLQITWTLTNCTISADASTAPDGTVTADEIIESGATNVEHSINQTYTVGSAAADFTFAASVFPRTRTWCVLRIVENTGGSSAYAFCNLSTGAIGTTSGGANFANVRAHVVAQGIGYFRIYVTGRKTNAATSLSCYINSATADNSFTYAGSATTRAIAIWRCASSAGSLPTRGAVTTSAAVVSDTPTGAALNVKGLPVSTAGLLLVGDWFEIDGQLKMVTASLDSDAAGLGYLQFSPPLRRAVSDNTPIIVNRPMGRFMLAADANFSNEPGSISGASIELEEAFS